MSQENVKVVRDAYEASNRGDWDALFRLTHPDIEWETDARLPNAGIYRGPKEIRRFIEDQAAPFDRTVTEVERLLANGDHVVAFIRVRRRVRASTAEVDLRIAHVWAFRDGKLFRCQAFAEREEALEATGLRE